MNINELSDIFEVRKLDEYDVENIYNLCKENREYYKYCPPYVTKDNILRDMTALPDGCYMENKYYIGYFNEEGLVAVLDLISGYPEYDTFYIGFFMMKFSMQGKNIGSYIIEELCNYLKNVGIKAVELAWITGNEKAKNFWIKNKFIIMEQCRYINGMDIIKAKRNL